ncbi:MAG: hypothetical protein IPL32_11040 [Chloracidobacterium sp.]|nr:hypothetical protein [Chloracidobacterium sp.]
MKKILFILTLTSVSALTLVAQTTATTNQASYARPNAEKRFKRFVNDTVGPFSWVGVAASSGFSTIRNEPEEWGKSAKGFGKRFASTLGKNVIRNTAIYGMDEALKIDSHFYRSKKRDFGSRAGNAIASTFTARTANGKRTVGVSRIVGTYAANVIAAEAWYPPRYNWKDGMKSGTISLGANSVFNLFKEFVLKK